MGNTTDLLTDTVYITPNNTGWAILTATCSNDMDGPPFSEVYFKEKNATNKIVDHIYDPYSYPEFEPMHIQTYNVYLFAGTEYELTAIAKGSSESTAYGGAAFSIGSLTWNQIIPGTYKSAGGLRIKEIRSYSDANAEPVIKTYKYGENESGYGSLLVPSEFLGVFSDTKKYVLGYTPPNSSGCIYYETDRITFYGNTINTLSTLSGSPVVYSTVTEFIGTPTSNNGKIVHNFDVALDDIQGVPQAYKNGRYQTNTSWIGGDEIKTAHYKSDGDTKTGQNEQDFFTTQNLSNQGFIVGWRSIHSGCVIPDGFAIPSDYYWFDYDIYTGVKRRSSDTQIQISSDAGGLQTAVLNFYYYDNPEHWLLSRSKTQNSNGDIIEMRYNYPQDYSGTVENIQSLVNNNIIGVPIKTEKVVNDMLIEGTVIKYNDDGKPLEVYKYESATLRDAPPFDSTQLLPSHYVERLSYEYDNSTKNLKNVFKTDDVPQTYIFGYNGSLPIAKIDNATQNDVEVVLGSGYKNGLVSLSQAQNDNLRSNAQLSNAIVSSYTYDPLVGITSIMDPSGLETFYNYDKFQRLEAVKDDNSDIIKAYEYQYQTLPELNVSTNQISLSSSAQTSDVDIISNVSWTVTDDRSWISTSPTSGSGNETLGITVTANGSASPRTGTVTVSENDGSGVPDQQISVSQAGVTPYLTVSTTELLFGASQTQSFTISTNTDWIISVTYYDDNGWLSISPSSGSGNTTVDVTSSSAQANNWEAEIQVYGGGIYRYIDVVKYY